MTVLGPALPAILKGTCLGPPICRNPHANLLALEAAPSRIGIGAACPMRRYPSPAFVSRMPRRKGSDSSSLDPSKLSALDQRTVAVQLSVMGQTRVLLGRGAYERDSEQGPVLRIRFESDPDSEIQLVERQWNGEILPGGDLGCDFLIRLDAV
jgi:hypothetical protein